MSFRNLALIISLAYPILPMAGELSCPTADTFLSQSVGDAKNKLNSLFPNNWSVNGPLCTTGYSNLMTDKLSGLCNKPISIDRIIVFGFNDSNLIIGVGYILPGNISEISLSSLLPIIQKEQLTKTEKIPALLAPLFRNQHGEAWNFISNTGRLFVRAHSDIDIGQTSIAIYDLQSIANQQEDFDMCLKEFGL